MTIRPPIRVSVTHHEPGNRRPLIAQVFGVLPDGGVPAAPSAAYGVAPGSTAIVYLRASDVLVVREASRHGVPK